MLGTVLPWPLGTWGSWHGIIKRLSATFTASGSAFYAHVRTLTRESLRIIDERRADPQGTEGKRDLLSLFLECKDREGVSFSDPKHRMQLRNIVLNFVIAGRDTTACLLSWTFYILATHPEIQVSLCVCQLLSLCLSLFLCESR